ncbi:MAG: DUF1788 domain-containing protein [Acidimicrobiales bacterium]
MAWLVQRFGSTGMSPASRRLCVPLPKSIQEIADRILGSTNGRLATAPPGVPVPATTGVSSPATLPTFRRFSGPTESSASPSHSPTSCGRRSRTAAVLTPSSTRNATARCRGRRVSGGLLKRTPILADRIVERVDESPPRTAVFLYRAGALYPALRTRTPRRALGRARRPVTMLYPGRLHGSHGLSFMDVLPPHYGYRAVIVPRGDDE